MVDQTWRTIGQRASATAHRRGWKPTIASLWAFAPSGLHSSTQYQLAPPRAGLFRARPWEPSPHLRIESRFMVRLARFGGAFSCTVCGGNVTKSGRRSGNLYLGSAGAVGSPDAFREGYIAGWQSVRGADENPDFPACPANAGMSMYLIGFSRGAGDARVVMLRPRQPSPSGPSR
jgi:hypothetical protein